MPLRKGTSKEMMSQNIAEVMHSYKRTGRIGSSKPTTSPKARKQAIAIAFDMKARSRK